MANKEEEARRLAADYLSSMPGQITPEASAPPPVVDAGDITMGDRIKTGIKTAFSPPPAPLAKDLAKGAAGVALGPYAAAAQGLATTTEKAPPSKVLAQALGPGGFGSESTPEAQGPPAPPGQPTTDPPIMLGSQGGGGPAQMVSPAGMYPHSLTTQAHMGRPVPGEAKAAFGASTGMQLEGAAHARDADQVYYSQVANLTALKEKATDDARVAHANVAARRQAMAKQKIAEIEATNAEAAAAIDPNKYWTDRGAGAGVLGAIAIALGEFGSKLNGGPNTALNIIDNGVNREIQTQMQNRTLKGQKAARQQQILDLHMGVLDNEDKAIDASKLALYDNVLGQVEKYKAQHGAQMSQANYEQLVGGILEKRGELVNKIGLQEEDDINKQYNEQWHNAQYAGGGGAGGAKFEDPKHIITIPASDHTGEKEVSVAVPESVYKDLSSQQGMTNQLVTLNQNAKKTRAELREAFKAGDYKTINTLQKRLEGYNNTRVALAEKAKDPNSAVRDPEFNRQLATGVDYTAGILGHDVGTKVDKAIDNDSNTAQSLTDARIRGATGQVVRHGINRSKEGYVVNQWVPTGEIYRGRAVAPEKK